jgi:hypothetical protein
VRIKQSEAYETGHEEVMKRYAKDLKLSFDRVLHKHQPLRTAPEEVDHWTPYPPLVHQLIERYNNGTIRHVFQMDPAIYIFTRCVHRAAVVEHTIQSTSPQTSPPSSAPPHPFDVWDSKHSDLRDNHSSAGLEHRYDRHKEAMRTAKVSWPRIRQTRSQAHENGIRARLR